MALQSINDFSSIFEVMFGLNIAYAGSSRFKAGIDRKIISISDKLVALKAEVDKLRGVTTVTISSVNGEELSQKILHKIEILEEDVKRFELGQEAKERAFVNGFRAMFLITALYCFILLILGGYEQFFEQKKITNSGLLFLHAAGLYNLYIFCRSFSVTDTSKDIHMAKPIGLILLSLICAVSFCYLCDSGGAFGQPLSLENNISNNIGERLNFTLALIIAFSSYGLHFIRAYIHNKRQRGPVKEFTDSITQRLVGMEMAVDIVQDKEDTSAGHEAKGTSSNP